MTMTSDLTTKAAEIRAGLVADWRKAMEGVTPGEWFQTGSPWFSSGDGVLAGSPDGNIGYLIADLENFAIPRDEYGGPFKLGDAERDAAWIARCSPAGVSDLLALIEQQAAELAGCEPYLKPGETPRQRLERYHAEVLGLMKLLVQDREKRTTAESERDELLREKERHWGGIRELITAAVWRGTADEVNGKPNGDIIVKGCEAAEYVIPEDAAGMFVECIVDEVVAALSSASQGSGQSLADAHSKSPDIASQSERIAVLEAALRDEREACAQSISSFIQAPGNFGKSEDYLQGFAAGANYTADRNAVAIRARAALAPLGEE